MTHRRNFLAMTAGAVAARTVLPIAARAEGVVSANEAPDAALIAACNEFVDLEQQANATFGRYDDDDPREIEGEAERDRLYAKQDPLIGLICEHRAVTAEGHRARARALFTWDADLMSPGECCFDRRMTAAIVRDLLAMGAA